MSHKCLRCGSVYEDNDDTVLRGCTCGSVFFMYIRTQQDTEKLNEIEKELESRNTTLTAEIEKKISKPKEAEGEKEETVETVKIPKEGVYEINLDALMKKEPLIILRQGKTYLVHLPSVFEQVKER